MQQSDILTLLAANVTIVLILRSTSAPTKSTTAWKNSSKKKIKPATTSSKSMRPTEKLNSPPESSHPSPTWMRLLLSVLKNTGKEPCISLDSTLALLPAHPQDGFLVPSPISWPKNSKNPDSCSLPIPRATDKPSLKPHTSTSPPLPCVTLTLQSISSMWSSHATTECQKLSLQCSGCWQEKSWSWEA